MTESPSLLEYAYTHVQTEATTGYFSCEPQGLDETQALLLLESRPWDDFLHLHCLRLLYEKNVAELRELAAAAWDGSRFLRPALAALLLECGVLHTEKAAACADFPADAARRLAGATPALYLRAAACENAAALQAWSEVWAGNILEHHALPHPDDAEALPPPLFAADVVAAEQKRMAEAAPTLARLCADRRAGRLPDGLTPAPAWGRPPAQETFLRAMDALMEADILAGPEMRHEASLSPIALLRNWRVDMRCEAGRNRWHAQGQATAYGRGLSLAGARASYAMEIVERASAYVSVGKGECAAEEVLQRAEPLPLLRAACAALKAEGRSVLAPDALPLEAPAPDAPLYWLAGQDPEGSEVLVPAQAVFLFFNADEPAIFLAGGSTGLASGNIMEEARVAALTEIIERDAEATTPFCKERCFRAASRDPRLQALLDDYAARGMQVQFQDITTELGVPAYQCFVMGPRGQVARATGANLCGARAALAALTETPWPYPYGGPTGPALRNLPVRLLEDLPDYSLPSPQDNLRLLEDVLRAHGRTPVYVNLTRGDFAIPVVRALIPGLELNADWDRFSRPSLRLMARR